MPAKKPNTKARGNGQGSIYKPKGSSTWTVQVTIGWKANSEGTGLVPVKKTKGGFHLKKDAVRYVDELFNSVAKKRITLQQLYDDWDPYYSPRTGRSTMDCYKYAFNHFAPLHPLFIDQITAADLQKCMDDCSSGKRTHENMKCVAGLLWHYAYDRGLTDRDITKNLYTGKGKKMKREPITEQELDVIRRAIGYEDYANYVYAHCYLGFRPGEFLGLTKSCVTKENGMLIITAGGKTEAGTDRRVPVPAAIQDIIKNRMEQPGTEYLFPRAVMSRGCFAGWKPMTHDYYNKHIFKPLMQKLGIAEGKVPYCARHTYANKLKKAKGDDQTKASLMGHTDYSFTQQAYQSVTEKELKTVAKSIR